MAPIFGGAAMAAAATLATLVAAALAAALLLALLRRRLRKQAALRPPAPPCQSFLERKRAKMQKEQQERRGRRPSKTATLVLPVRSPSPEKPLRRQASADPDYLEVSARQVFDVQWSLSNKELTALEFKRPAGTGPTGGFFRPAVDLANDLYRLMPSEECPGQFQLRQYGGDGALKHQLTSYGHIKAISGEAILYSGDAQYGTLLTLECSYDYGSSASFRGLTTAPTREQVLEVFGGYGSELKMERVHSHVQKAPQVRTPLQVSASMMDMARPSMKVRFGPKVSTVFLKNLRSLPAERKAEIWWGPEDFAAFLSVRVQLGKVYRQAARQLGVEIFKVSSEGSHREEAYAHMVSQFPELAQESRRGLGLGRKNQRARNRDAYIAAVLREQARQRRAAYGGSEGEETAGERSCYQSEGSEDEEEPLEERVEAAAAVLGFGEKRGLRGKELRIKVEDSEAETTAPATPATATPPRSFVLDEVALARVAESISKRDRDYAHSLAQVYYEQDRLEISGECPDEAAPVAVPDLSSPPDIWESECQWESEASDSPLCPSSPTAGTPRGARRLGSCETALRGEDDLPEEESEDGRGWGKALSKGFGISRDKLLEVGLSATGHAVTRRKRRFACGELSSDGESDVESGGSDWEA